MGSSGSVANVEVQVTEAHVGGGYEHPIEAKSSSSCEHAMKTEFQEELSGTAANTEAQIRHFHR